MRRSSAIFVVSLAFLPACSESEPDPDNPTTAGVIGPDGGTVATSSGASVTAPSGAVDSDVEVSVGAVGEDELAADVPADTTLRGTPYRFLPHGTTFLVPVTIELPYTGNANQVLRLDDENDTSWEPVTGVTFANGKATLQTSSFSVYVPAEAAGPVCVDPSTGPASEATYTGGSFTALGAVGIVSYRTDIATEGGGQPYRTELDLRLTDFANPWGFEAMELYKQGSKWFHVTLMAPSQTGFPELPAAGTYSYSSALPMPWDTWAVRGVGELFDSDECDTTGSLGGMTPPSGTVTLSAVSATEATGSFSFTMPDQTNVSGTFTAPLATRTVAEEDLCCWNESGGVPPGVEIGPAGGEVSAGPVTLTVPAGALDSSVEIKIEPVLESSLSAGLPTRVVVAGTPYGFTPYQTTFFTPATITLPATSSANRVLYLSDEYGGMWNEVASPTFATGTVTITTSELGIFAVGEYSPPVCDAPSGGAPTATVTASGTFNGGGTWTAVDALATFDQLVVGGLGETGYVSRLEIQFTEYANACGLGEAGWIVPDVLTFRLVVQEQSETASPGMPAAGTYALTDGSTPPMDTPLFISAQPVTGEQSGDECGYAASAFGGSPGTGSLVIDAISSTEIQGSFDVTDPDGGTHSGTFTAPMCDVVLTGCCYSL